MKNFVFVDVEADGPCPGLYSMVSFGAVLRDDEGKVQSYYGKTKPISDNWIPEALAVSGISREEHLSYPDPSSVIVEFSLWLMKHTKSRGGIFISDNNGFDWQWINYYFHKYMNANPFGFSSRRIGDIYSGFQKDLSKSSEWKKFRRTRHTHNPVDDAMGNLEAFETMMKMMKDSK